MSILDFLSKPLASDSEQNKALMNGLIQAGMSLLASRGNFGNALGQAGMAGLQGAQQYRDNRFQQQLRQGQLEEIKRKKQMQDLSAQFQRPGMRPPTMDDRDVGQAGEQAIPAQQFDYGGYANAIAAYDPVASIQLRAALQKDDKPIISKPGDVARDATGRLLWQNEQDAKDPEDIRALKVIYGEGTPQYKAALARLGTKKTTHSPGVQVSYGQPVAGVDATGNPVFFQPDKGGGAPAIVPGVKPAPQNRDTKLPAELQRMQIAGDSMVELMDEYERMLRKYNPRDPVTQANPTVRADIQALKRNIELQFKELQALGALAGPDIEIMRQSMADPFSMSGAYYGRDGLLAQVRQARNLVKIRKEAVLKSQGREAQIPPSNTNDDPLGLRGN